MRQLFSNTPDGLGHPDSHYGIQRVVDVLPQIADDYAAAHPGDRLRYNDMSLVFGGVFDISGDWNPAGRDGHKSHACGTDLDIDNSVNRRNNPNPVPMTNAQILKETN